MSSDPSSLKRSSLPAQKGSSLLSKPSSATQGPLLRGIPSSNANRVGEKGVSHLSVPSISAACGAAGAFPPTPKVPASTYPNDTADVSMPQQRSRHDGLLENPAASNADTRDRYLIGQRKCLSSGIIAQTAHLRRLDFSVGGQYKPHPIVAQNSWTQPSNTAQTNHICIVLCFRPQSWQELGHQDRDDDVCGAVLSSSSLGKIYGWRSPRMLPGSPLRGLEEVSKAYEAQYATMVLKRQVALTVTHCVNPMGQDVTNSLRQLRQAAGKGGKVLFHYSGHGVSRPRGTHIILRGSASEGDAVRYNVDSLRSAAEYPLIVIADCPSAGTILKQFDELHRKDEAEQSMQRYRSGGIPPTPSSTNIPPSGGHLPAFQPSCSAVDLDGSADGRSGMGGRRMSSAMFVASPVQSTTATFNQQSLPQPVRDDFYFVGACADGDVVPSHALLPNDILTACLTSPITMSVLWYIVSSRTLADVHPMLIHMLPGIAEDKKTPLGLLKWAFECYTDSIAWSLLSPELFSRLFRQDALLSNVFRGYLLAHRLVSSQLGGNIVVYPHIPVKSMSHPLWLSWDVQVEKAVAALRRAAKPPPSAGLSHQEFRDVLDISFRRLVSSGAAATAAGATAVTVVDSADVIIQPSFMVEELQTISANLDRLIEQGYHAGRDPALSGVLLERMPTLFQATLVLLHREEAVRLICRFVDLGEFAIADGVEINLFSYSLKNLWRHPQSVGHRAALLFIYAKATYLDPKICSDDVRKDVVTNALQYIRSPLTLADLRSSYPSAAWQIKTLRQYALPTGQVVLAASLVAMIAVRSLEHQATCIECGALDVCCEALARYCSHATPRMEPFVTGPCAADGAFAPGGRRSSAVTRSPGGCIESSPFVSEIVAVDTDVAMRLCLLAMLSSLVLNVPVVDDTIGDVKIPAGTLTITQFRQVMERCAMPLRYLQTSEFPSVRLAATRTVAVILCHPAAGCVSPRVKPSPTMSSSDPLRVGALVVALVNSVVDRCERSLPMESNLDVRLEQIGLLCSLLLRHAAVFKDSVSLDTMKQAFLPPQHTAAPPASGRAYPRGGAADGHGLQGHMTPFALPNAAGGSDTASSLPNEESLDDKSVMFSPPQLLSFENSVEPSPLPTPQLRARPAPANADMLQPSSGGLLMKHQTSRVGRSIPKHVYDACSNTKWSAASDILNDDAAALCLALKHLLIATRDACPMIRLHACKAIEKLTNAGIIPSSSGGMLLDRMSQSIGSRSSIERGGASLVVGSKRSFTERISHLWRGGTSLKQHNAAPSLPPARNAPKRGDEANVRDGTSYRASYSEVSADDEEDTMLRLVSHSDARTIHSQVFTAVSYLEQINLVPLDDHDPRHPVNESVRHDLDQFAKTVGSHIESSSKSLLEKAGLDARWDPFFEREIIGDAAKALAFHPTEKLLAVANQTDVVSLYLYHDKCEDKKPLLAFSASSVGRRWQPRSAWNVLAAPFAASLSNNNSIAGTSTLFDSSSEIDTQSDAPLTPHARPSSFGRDHPSGVSFAPTQGDAVSSIVSDLVFIDAYRATPLLATVHVNGSVSLFALNLPAAFAMQTRPVRSAAADELPPDYQHVVRVSTFQTMTYENRESSIRCVNAYHSPAQQLHVATPDGHVATWDISAEQLVGLRSSALGPTHSTTESSTSAFQAAGLAGSYVSAIGADPVNPFLFCAANDGLLLFDTRLRKHVARMEPPTRSDRVSAGVCLHVGFSLRYEFMITGGFSTDAVVAAWDRRCPGRTYVQHSVVLAEGGSSSASSPTLGVGGGSGAALFMSVHATHPDTISASVNNKMIGFTEGQGGGNATKKFKVKPPGPTAFVFHPTTTIAALASGGNKLQLFSRKLLSHNEVARQVLGT